MHKQLERELKGAEFMRTFELKSELDFLFSLPQGPERDNIAVSIVRRYGIELVERELKKR